MAMNMMDNLIRKACDRCHAQKLSCKRSGEEPCERCVRLKAECKSSPSLRYKKQQHHQQHQQHQSKQQQQSQDQQQPHHVSSTEAAAAAAAIVAQGGRPSPKRRRTTESEMSLVQPETVPMLIQPELVTSQNHHHHTVVTQDDPMLALADFNFSMEHQHHQPAMVAPAPPGFYAPSAGGPSEYLFSSAIPTRVDDFPPQSNTAFAEFWDATALLSTATYQEVPPLPFINPHNTSVAGALSSVPFRKRTSHRSGSRSQSSAKQGSKQIALRHNAKAHINNSGVSAPVHWMARFSEIHTRLLELSASLPSSEVTAQNPALGRPVDERFLRNGFPVDEVFALTGHVADTFEEVCTTANPEAAQARLNSSDPGNSLFALSIYVRLLDIFQRIFGLVRRELALAESHVEFRYWKLPDVSIGSIEVDSSPRFQMFLAVQVALQFLTRLRKTTGMLHSSSSAGSTDAGPHTAVPNGASIFSGPVDDTILAVQQKETTLVAFLAELRAELEAFRDSVEYEDESS
ncbi:hypothetical protein S7711_02473 [Stachybotrys chartarum IBT 7711]|uniref:Zn(2)-C6 fungal-type domain-containing protein n=1 Tax=Stachybotrys chartarum (strain CBS 109288 / IBT 7711) TaxID=1280523 RepID=A0A084B553_STACB|nr:hypothetical protein S7711_02473 [Stachybotrys chartarum IBT 7711]